MKKSIVPNFFSFANKKKLDLSAGQGLLLRSAGAVLFVSLLFVAAHSLGAPLAARDKEESPGFAGEIAGDETDILQAVRDIVEDQIIHGTWVYDRERTLTGASSENSSKDFPEWKGPGRVFYKIYRNALAPRFFVDSADLGRITVRYVVQNVAPQRMRIRIDAVFVENERRTVHPSEGLVESSEFKAIQDRFQAIELQNQQVEEARAKQAAEMEEKQALLRQRQEEAARLATAESSAQDLLKRVQELRRKVEMRTVAAGAQLRSAPFQGAATLQKLRGSSEVAILILTSYWYGVETAEGQRGWIRKEELEPLP